MFVVYIAGATASSGDFPLATPIQPVYGGGSTDEFVAKFAPPGNALEFCTYLGAPAWSSRGAHD